MPIEWMMSNEAPDSGASDTELKQTVRKNDRLAQKIISNLLA